MQKQWLDIYTRTWMEGGWMDGWMNGWMDGWADSNLDGWGVLRFDTSRIKHCNTYQKSLKILNRPMAVDAMFTTAYLSRNIGKVACYLATVLEDVIAELASIFISYKLIETLWRIQASVGVVLNEWGNGLSTSHYLDQWWFITNWALRSKLQWNFYPNEKLFWQKYIRKCGLQNVGLFISFVKCIRKFPMPWDYIFFIRLPSVLYRCLGWVCVVAENVALTSITTSRETH